MQEIINLSLTPLDILYTVLSVSAVILTVFLSVLIYRAARFIRNVNRITEALANLVELWNAFMIKPIQLLDYIIDLISGLLERATKKVKGKK